MSRRAVLIVFSALVYAPLLSGLEVCRLDTTSLSRLNRCVLKYGRKLMCGNACEKQVLDDDSVKHIAKSNTAVWDFLQLASADRELRVRRLKWCQTLAKDPIKHSVFLAALFGKLQFEHADTISNDGVVANSANPWALQFRDDIESIAEIDDGVSLLTQLNGRHLRVLWDLRDRFLLVDSTAIRMIPLRRSIPPPVWQPTEAEEPIQLRDDDAAEPQYSCTCSLADGTPCPAKFPTRRQLALHMAHTLGGSHGAVPAFRRATSAA